MNNQTRWILTFVIILALSTLACTTLLGDDESDAQADRAEIDQAIESLIPDEQESEEPISEDQASFFTVPKEADSYRIAFSMAITVGQGTDATPVMSVNGEGTVTNDPSASSLTFHVLGIEGAATFSDMTMIQIEDESYFVLPSGDCLSGLFGQDDIPFDDITQGIDFAEGISDATPVERNVEINGINTDHYSFSQSDLGESSFIDDSIQNFEGNLYISEDGHLVRVTFSGEGGVDLSGLVPVEGSRVSYQLDYFDINEPIEISVPEGCNDSSATDLPVVSDAFEINAFGGLTSYLSNLNFDEVVDFYRTEMAAEGWTLDQEFTIGTANNLTFSLNDASVLVTVEEDSATGQITVLLIEQ